MRIDTNPQPWQKRELRGGPVRALTGPASDRKGGFTLCRKGRLSLYDSAELPLFLQLFKLADHALDVGVKSFYLGRHPGNLPFKRGLVAGYSLCAFLSFSQRGLRIGLRLKWKSITPT